MSGSINPEIEVQPRYVLLASLAEERRVLDFGGDLNGILVLAEAGPEELTTCSMQADSLIAQLQEAEVEGLLNRWARLRAEESLAALIDGGEVQIVERFGRRFWCAAGLTYPDPLEGTASALAS